MTERRGSTGESLHLVTAMRRAVLVNSRHKLDRKIGALKHTADSRQFGRGHLSAELWLHVKPVVQCSLILTGRDKLTNPVVRLGRRHCNASCQSFLAIMMVTSRRGCYQRLKFALARDPAFPAVLTL
ncbi:MAG TPA: hypothetical protein VIC83_06995 [Candidatus Limnocylindria bacterium]